MLDATGELIDEVGYEHLTTQQVARRSGVSIGLVYHYFPDRLALVEALIARNSERFMAEVAGRMNNPEVTTWRDALNAVLDVLIEMYRREPGFCKIGLNDRFLTAQSAPVIADHDNLAAAFLSLFRERFAPEGPEPPDLLLRFEIAVQIGDALMGRAFRTQRDGDERIMAEARTVLADYLAPYLDRQAPTAEAPREGPEDEGPERGGPGAAGGPAEGGQAAGGDPVGGDPVEGNGALGAPDPPAAR